MTHPSLAGIPRAAYNRTARRLEWDMLPPALRDEISRRLGSPVEHASSQGGGFTPGFASVLTCADGSKHFVKAANTVAQKMFADSYREEIRKIRALPPGLPAPRLLWSQDADWVVLELAYVDGALPERPWSPTQLAGVLDALEVVADALTPPPDGLELDTFAAEIGAEASAWDYVRRALPDLPHLAEATALAARSHELVGSTVVHTDVREDNLLVGRDEQIWICDWNWPVLGPAWIDTACVLISVFADGIDTEPIISERALVRDVDPDHIDILLALLAGYFFRQRDLPVPNSSPSIRLHQNWYAEATWAWLCDRRGWSQEGTD